MSATIFKAVVWKELRENLRWAVVVLLGMTAVVTYMMRSLVEQLRGEGIFVLRITDTLEMTTTVVAILAGLLIGGAQALAENRGDKWGFLAHRPVSRSTLFWGKATAGVLLYAISTGVPVIAALLWMATPGHLPLPFEWSIALPVIANLLCGLVFYCAGLLTGMREARWYASRALGIGAGAWCIALQMSVPAFWQAVALSATGLIIVGTAAWSTFVAGGQYGVQPRIGRAATGVSIGLGITLAGWLAFGIIVFEFHLFEAPRESRDTSYAVTTEGAVVRITSERGRVVEVSELDGRPLEQYVNSTRSGPLGANVSSVRLSQRPRPTPSFRSTDGLFSLLRPAVNGSKLSWYYVHRLGLIAAYDSRSRNLIGWMGPDGFSPGDTKPRPFAGRLKNPNMTYNDVQTLLVFDDAVYRVDLERRSVEKAFQPEPAEQLLDATSTQDSAIILLTRGQGAGFEAISTTRRVIVQLRDGTKILEAPLAAQDRGYPVLVVSRALRAPAVPTFLWYQGQGDRESHISQFNAGAVVNSWILPATTHESKEPWPRIAIFSVITPLIGQASFEFADRILGVGSYLSRSHDNARWAATFLSALVSAVAVLLRGRRYAFPPGRLYAWTGIALLLGPLGYVMMLALIEWPALEPCPACSRKRVVTRVRCEHCQEPFAEPPKDGTEIFEPMPANPPA